MVEVWSTQPDYAHGFLVPFIAVLLLWMRREHLPAAVVRVGSIWFGLSIVTISIAIRIISARYFLTPVENWMILGVLTGFVIATCGWPVGRWALPAILFLIFAMPLPYQLETQFRQPLRAVATEVSSQGLIMLGYPAVAEANTIQIQDHVYGVNQACSGLRIFWGIAAFAYALAVLSRGHWIVRLLLMLSVVPVAIAGNATRIIATCILSETYPSVQVKESVHDWAGLIMIPYALLILGVVYWLLIRTFPWIEVIETSGFGTSSPSAQLTRSSE
jgi:exosortase